MVSSQDSALLKQQSNRRSFSSSIMSSIDVASSKLSMSVNGGRRSVSVSRVSSASMDDSDELSASISAYSMYQPVFETDVVPKSQFAAHETQSSIQGSRDRSAVRQTYTEESDDLLVSSARPSSTSSLYGDDLNSANKHNAKWYRCFSRNGSSHKLSRAVGETSDNNSVSSASPIKFLNAFSRRRSVPVMPKAETILGQTAKKAIQTGGHASCASKLLPRDLLPRVPIEIPYIVDTCISWLIEHDAHRTPGIFRINGSDKAVRTLIDHFSSGNIRMPLEQLDLPDGQMISVHDVASCLKKFLVLMPGGLLGVSVFESLSAISDESETLPPDAIVKDIAEAFHTIKDRPKFYVVLILMALLRHIADETKGLAIDDKEKQESGYMTALSLSIVFSPTCLGSRIGPTDMRRSSTSYSDRSLQSNQSTPIEEAVAAARLGAKVIQMLVNLWPDILRDLVLDDEILIDDSVKMLEVINLPHTGHTDCSSLSRPLQTIIDSPIRDKTNKRSSTHTRTQSVETVIQGRACNCESALLIRDAQLDIKQSKIEALKIEKTEALKALQEKTEENAKLFARILTLERENSRLLLTQNFQTRAR